MIPAHESPLAALTFNPSGTRLATASEKGTVIRVFSVEDGSRLVEFRYEAREQDAPNAFMLDSQIRSSI